MEEKKKSSTSWVVLACLVVAVVVCCVFLFAKQLTKNTTPKNMFVNGVENLFKQEKSVKDFDTVKAQASISLNVKTSLIDKDILDLINKLSLKFNADVDVKNSIANIGINTKYDNDQVIDAKMYLDETALYVYLNDIFDKWIKVESNEIKGFSSSFDMSQANIDPEELKTFATEVKNALLGALKDGYFTKEKEDDFNKVTLTITKDNALEIVTDFIKNLKNSEKFKDVAKKITGTEVETTLDQALESLKEVPKSALSDLSDIKVSVYLDKDNEIKKMIVDTTIQGQPIKLEVEIEDKNFSMNAYMMGVKLASLTIKQTENGDITKTVVDFSVTSMIEATLTIESSIKYNETIEKADVSNSVDIYDINETQANTILEKVMSSKGLTKLLEAIEKVMPQGDLDYDYDYDYDYEY